MSQVNPPRLPVILLIVVSLLVPAPGNAQPDLDAFRNWLTDFRERARGNGVSKTTLDKYLKDLRPDTRILEEDENQAEFTTPFTEYRGYFVTPEMVNRGRSLLSSHEQLLDKIEDRYGVPGEILVAIWGIESRYGEHSPDHPAIKALASLAYKQDERGNYFEDELLTLLQLVEREEIPPELMNGSWAGALGQPQFMPSSYDHYSVDFDGDGQRNIWTSTPDVLGSIAHYLAENGWKDGQPWLQHADGSPQSQEKRVIKPDSANTAYRVYENFDILLRYNPSNHYGLTVGILANKIKSD